MNQKLLDWLERGKGIGQRYSFVRNQTLYYSSISLKKAADDLFVVAIWEIEESRMAAETFERNETTSFTDLESALAFIERTTLIQSCELRPGKGTPFQ